MKNLVPIDLTEKIFSIIGTIRKKVNNLETNLKLESLLKHKINGFIEANKPIQIILPAFPCKSPNNRDKVLGKLPDKGESLAIQNINEVCMKIKSLFSPGTDFTIVSDGIVFNDLLGVSDKDTKEYNDKITRMTKNTLLKTKGLDEFFEESSFAKSREKLMDEFFSTKDLIKNTDLQCAFTLFMKDDLFFDSELSKTQIQKKSKEIAKKMIKRNNAYSNLVSKKFPEAIRFSIHQHEENFNKIGINLVNSSSSWNTPWHNVAVKRSDSSWELMPKKQAEENGFQLILENKIPSHFEE